jgi:SulP family sulfate permease
MSQSATSSSWTELLADGARAVGGRIRAVAPRRRDLVAMLRTPRADLIAGLTVGVVALPLALAFGIASGVGATAGLVTAVVAGTVAALFGGSAVQVSGPTGAMTVVLVPIVGQFGSTGVLVVGLLAGLMLVAMGLAGLGAYVRYIPLPVIEGFTLGIAVIIALQQVPAALGVQAHGEQVLAVASSAVWTWVQSPTWAAPTIAITVAAALLVWRRVKPSVPVALLAVAAATTIATLAHLPVSTIGYRCGYLNNASFTRAFSRRFGIAPTQLRHGQLAA